uniref:Uncharacterized protein n=1 Tax=Rhizophora mucronata TaxID=61149 RepID=A0A2P2LJ66_RHIMU
MVYHNNLFLEIFVHSELLRAGSIFRGTFYHFPVPIFAQALVRHKYLMSTVHLDMTTWRRSVGSGRQQPSK